MIPQTILLLVLSLFIFISTQLFHNSTVPTRYNPGAQPPIQKIVYKHTLLRRLDSALLNDPIPTHHHITTALPQTIPPWPLPSPVTPTFSSLTPPTMPPPVGTMLHTKVPVGTISTPIYSPRSCPHTPSPLLQPQLPQDNKLSKYYPIPSSSLSLIIAITALQHSRPQYRISLLILFFLNSLPYVLATKHTRRTTH